MSYTKNNSLKPSDSGIRDISLLYTAKMGVFRIEEQIKELQKAQTITMNEKSIHPSSVCDIAKTILEIVQELRIHNY